VLVSRLQITDETGVQLRGKLHWLHVNSTRWLTYLAWYRKRGCEALEMICIWPCYRGHSTRDRWASHDYYSCLRSVFVAHVVHDLIFEHEQKGQVGASEKLEAFKKVFAPLVKKLDASDYVVDEQVIQTLVDVNPTSMEN